jgi:chromosome segregation ATPase
MNESELRNILERRHRQIEALQAYQIHIDHEIERLDHLIRQTRQEMFNLHTLWQRFTTDIWEINDNVQRKKE